MIGYTEQHLMNSDMRGRGMTIQTTAGFGSQPEPPETRHQHLGGVNMFGKKEEEQRFYIKSSENVPSLGRIIVLVDRETGVNYLQTWVGSGSGITPLLDRDGQVVVEEKLS